MITSPEQGSAKSRDTQADVALLTYRHLRWLMILLPVVLFAVTTGSAIYKGQLEGSISAYYGGPVRDVFVGVMVAIAACMVAYQGASLLEDYALNAAGFYALFVALVPSNLERTLADLRANTTPGGLTIGEYVAFLRTALTIVLAICVVLFVVEVRKSNRVGALLRSGPANRAFVVVTSAVLLAFLALAMWQLWSPPAADVSMNGLAVGSLRFRIHDIAAILLIGTLAVTVGSHAFPERVGGLERTTATVRQGKISATYRRIFQAILVLMTAGGVALGLVLRAVDKEHTVIWLEWWEIALFGTFWAVETWRVGRQQGADARSGPAVTADADGDIVLEREQDRARIR